MHSLGVSHLCRTYHFNQIDARCENGAQAGTVKSCGLVIHEGMSCDSPGDPLTMTGGCGGIQADWANSYYISTHPHVGQLL